jgi:hypothetical protein
MLFHLSRVYLVRNNGLHGHTSRPQISWGDSVYFLTRETLLGRLTGCAGKEREALLVRFVVLLLCHGIHDYAIEVLEAAETAKLVTPAFASSVKAAVVQSADTSAGYFLWSAVGLALSLAVYLGCWLIPSARLPAKYYFQQRAGRLFHELWLWTCRPHPACVEDPFD